jgi:hypothetical protein
LAFESSKENLDMFDTMRVGDEIVGVDGFPLAHWRFMMETWEARWSDSNDATSNANWWRKARDVADHHRSDADIVIANVQIAAYCYRAAMGD